MFNYTDLPVRTIANKFDHLVRIRHAVEGKTVDVYQCPDNPDMVFVITVDWDATKLTASHEAKSHWEADLKGDRYIDR